MLTEIGKGVSVEESAGRPGEHDLPSVAGSCHTRCEVNVVSDIARVGYDCRAGVQADAQVDTAWC